MRKKVNILFDSTNDGILDFQLTYHVTASRRKWKVDCSIALLSDQNFEWLENDSFAFNVQSLLIENALVISFGELQPQINAEYYKLMNIIANYVQLIDCDINWAPEKELIFTSQQEQLVDHY